MLYLLLYASFASATCPELATTADIVASVTEAETAFAAMDSTSFRRARKQAEEQLDCLGEPLTPIDAGSFHRMLAMDAFMARDQEEAVASFRAVHAAQPAYTLPSSIALEGSPLRVLFDQAGEQGSGDSSPVSVPPGLAVMVDGTRALALPTERPFLLQVLDGSGGVAWTGYLASGETPPAWEQIVSAEALSQAAARQELMPAPGSLQSGESAIAQQDLPKSGPRKPLLAGAGGTLLAAGVLYGIAGVMEANYKDEDNADYQTASDLNTLRARTNTLVITSAGLGVVGLGLGAAAFVEVRW